MMTLNYRARVSYSDTDGRVFVHVSGRRYAEELDVFADESFRRSLVRRAVARLFDVDGMTLDVTPSSTRYVYGVTATPARTLAGAR